MANGDSCVPKKITYNAAAVAEAIHDAKAYGFSVEQTAPFDWTSFKKKRDAYVKRLNDIYARNLDTDKVEHVHGRAHFTSTNSVEVILDDGSKQTITAKKILIATGGRPHIPTGIEGSEHGIDSDGFFDIEVQPKKVALIGAGYIAVEFAGMFNALGTETHLFIRGDTFLRSFDPMVQEAVTNEYERQGVHLHKNSSPSKIEKNAETGKLTIHDGSAKLEDVDVLIWAIGRSPEVEDLGLDKIGVKQMPSGHVQVDEFQNTNVPNIYALGDVIGRVPLTPVAIAAGRKLSDRIFGPPSFQASKLDYDLVPSVVFAHPEVGSIGLTEPQAIARFGADRVKVYTSSFTAMYYAVMDAADKGPTKYKIVCEGEEERVVGLHILGIGSAELLQGFGVAMKMGARKRDFDACVAIHPTSAEELVTMK